LGNIFLDILHQENVWLDALQNKVFSSANNGADAEEISEELDVRFERIGLIQNKSMFFYVDTRTIR